MALFIDGVDYYSGNGTDQLQSIWDVGSTFDAYTAVGAGAFAYGRAGQVGNVGVQKTLANIPGAGSGANWGTIYGVLHWLPGSTLGDDGANCVTFTEGATVQAVLRVNAAGNFKFYRGNAATLLATGTVPLTAGSYNSVAFKIVFSNTVGSIDLNVNGAAAISASGLDNCATANEYITKISFARTGGASTYAVYLDNIHIYNGSDGAPWNAISAERRVYFALANANGALTDWTPSAGSIYQCVDDNPPNGDTDYVSSGTVGHQFTITKAALSGLASVDAVQASIQARKDDATARGVKVMGRDNGGTLYKSAEFTMTSGYTFYKNQWLLDPATAAAWVLADFNNYQFGAEVST